MQELAFSDKSDAVKIHQREDGLIMAKGTVPRPRDEGEDKYRLASTPGLLPVSAANLNEPVLLPSSTLDPRAPVGDQGAIGSCAPWGGTAGIYLARNYAAKGRVAKRFHPGIVYEDVRRRRGWFPQDSGSYLADVLDSMLYDGPLWDNHGYYQDPAYVYPRTLWDDGVKYDYLLSHRPFYPSATVVEQVWVALKSGWPVMVGTMWPGQWSYPSRGKLPENVSYRTDDGGHAILIWGYIPGYFLCQNSWSPAWSRDAADLGYHMRPGDFAFPVSYFRVGGPVFELRAIVPERVQIQPDPQPDPDVKPDPIPDPKPDPTPVKPDYIVATESVIAQFAKEKKVAPSEWFRTLAKNRQLGAEAVLTRLQGLPKKAS